MQFTADSIRDKYDAGAARYDARETVFELLGVARLRRHLLRRATGRVLEVAVGTGKNLPYYPRSTQITAVDLSSGMLQRARIRAKGLGLSAALEEMDAEALTFPDHSFDTVVSTLSACTFPKPVAALREMGRVCRQDGRILLLEHGRSTRPWLARLQDRLAIHHAKDLGCVWNREPHELVQQAGLQVQYHKRYFVGVFQVIIARPTAT